MSVQNSTLPSLSQVYVETSCPKGHFLGRASFYLYFAGQILTLVRLEKGSKLLPPRQGRSRGRNWSPRQCIAGHPRVPQGTLIGLPRTPWIPKGTPRDSEQPQYVDHSAKTGASSLGSPGLGQKTLRCLTSSLPAKWEQFVPSSVSSPRGSVTQSLHAHFQPVCLVSASWRVGQMGRRSAT